MKGYNMEYVSQILETIITQINNTKNEIQTCLFM